MGAECEQLLFLNVKNREQIDCRPLKGQQGADSNEGPSEAAA